MHPEGVGVLTELISMLEASAVDTAGGGVLARLSLGGALAATAPADSPDPGRADPDNANDGVPSTATGRRRSARRGILGRLPRHQLLATILGTTERQVSERSAAWLPDPDQPAAD